MISAYASGCEKMASREFVKWRDELEHVATYYNGIKILNPMEHFNYGDKYPQSTKECYNYFMWMISKSDVIIVNLDESYKSIGTGMECQYGVDNKKPIIGFGKDKSTWYPWIEEACETIFDNVEDVVDYIWRHYGV